MVSMVRTTTLVATALACLVACSDPPKNVTLDGGFRDSGSDVTVDSVTLDRPPEAVPDGPCGAPDDPKNCGICGHDCKSLQHVRAGAAVGCQSGKCVLSPDA